MELILPAIAEVVQPVNLAVMALGLVIGMVIGAIPGLNVPLAVAITLPITFHLAPLAGISMLVGIYKGGTYGGSISAILINVPGTPAAGATALDGYALTRQGQASKALRIALYSSFAGGLISDLSLVLFAIPVALLALKIGPAENFALGILALTLIGVLSEGNMVKGLIAGALGILLSTVGLDPLNGETRLTFGVLDLSGGFQFISLIIGIFAIAEALALAQATAGRVVASVRERISAAGAGMSAADWRLCLPAMLRAAPVGVFIGAVPGLGSAISAFINYGIARNFSREPEKFGKGSVEGIAAAESGNNAVCGSTFIPLLTLGIPGDTITAIMLGAFMVHGLVPGPALFTTSADFVAAFFVAMLVSTFLMLAIGRIGLPLFVQAVRIPNKVLFPVVVALCMTGVYASSSSYFDLYVMLAFGLLGYGMKRYGFPVAPLLIGFILGPIVEVGMRQSLIISRGSIDIFFTRPIALACLLLAALVVVWVAIRQNRGLAP